jgi:hypothetical protein
MKSDAGQRGSRLPDPGAFTVVPVKQRFVQCSKKFLPESWVF